MIEYDRIDISEGIDINKTSSSNILENVGYVIFGTLQIKTSTIKNIFAMVVTICQ